jgi:hypothetical protein
MLEALEQYATAPTYWGQFASLQHPVKNTLLTLRRRRLPPVSRCRIVIVANRSIRLALVVTDLKATSRWFKGLGTDSAVTPCIIREANIMNNKRLWSTVGVSLLIGTLSFATGAFAHSSESLVSLGSETPRSGKLQFVPSVLAEADTATPSPKDRTNDVALTAKIKDALLADKATAGAADAIHVQTTNGIVTLTGDVASQATAEHAQAVTARLLGVRDVVNDLKYPHLPGSVSAPIVAPPTNASR